MKNMFPPHQYGFQTDRSTTELILQPYADAVKAFNTRKYTGVFLFLTRFGIQVPVDFVRVFNSFYFHCALVNNTIGRLPAEPQSSILLLSSSYSTVMTFSGPPSSKTAHYFDDTVIWVTSLFCVEAFLAVTRVHFSILIKRWSARLSTTASHFSVSRIHIKHESFAKKRDGSAGGCSGWIASTPPIRCAMWPECLMWTLGSSSPRVDTFTRPSTTTMRLAWVSFDRRFITINGAPVYSPETLQDPLQPTSSHFPSSNSHCRGWLRIACFLRALRNLHQPTAYSTQTKKPSAMALSPCLAFIFL